MQITARDHRHADAAVHVEDLVLLDMRHAPHIGQYRFGRRCCTVYVCAPNKDHEFVTTKPRNHVVAPHASAEFIRHLANQAISCRMAAGVVDVFELVKINEKQ